MGQRLPTLAAAAGVQLAEAVLVLVATVLAGIDAAGGRSYHVNSGIALTIIGAVCALALAWVAAGVGRGRPWSRTPALLTQLFVGIVGIYLLQAHRLDWGVPSVVLAVAGFAALLAPPSLRALSGGPRTRGEQQSGQRTRGERESGQGAHGERAGPGTSGGQPGPGSR
ncbi:MAG TPA: hypothetical protein VIX86_27295 [Streptosporangiaceae bacterium]